MARATPEQHLHIAVADLLRQFAKPDVLWFHVPNGGKMSPQRGARLKRMGVLAGAPDFIILTRFQTPDSVVYFVELKSPTGRLSPDQIKFRDRANWAGAFYSTFWNIDDAAQFLAAAGILTQNPFADARSSVLRRTA